jgi:hypothetical protein
MSSGGCRLASARRSRVAKVWTRRGILTSMKRATPRLLTHLTSLSPASRAFLMYPFKPCLWQMSNRGWAQGRPPVAICQASYNIIYGSFNRATQTILDRVDPPCGVFLAGRARGQDDIIEHEIGHTRIGTLHCWGMCLLCPFPPPSLLFWRTLFPPYLSSSIFIARPRKRGYDSFSRSRLKPTGTPPQRPSASLAWASHSIHSTWARDA